MKKQLLKYTRWLSGLKDQKKSLVFLIVLNVFMGIASNVVDWPWPLMVDWYLIPFTPICALYPLALALWFTLYFYKKPIPSWYTAFIVMGVSSYGLMAYLYYPLYMDAFGVYFRPLGNMVWVSIYALQALIILPELKKLPWYQYVLIGTYFGFKDYADRFLGTFIDVNIPDFTPGFMSLLFYSIIVLHILAFALIIYWPRRKAHKLKV